MPSRTRDGYRKDEFGPAKGAALTVADAVKETRDHAFLVWSVNHAALVAYGWDTTRIIWRARRAQRPAFDPAPGVTSRPDGSQIAFAIPGGSANASHSPTDDR